MQRSVGMNMSHSGQKVVWLSSSMRARCKQFGLSSFCRKLGINEIAQMGVIGLLEHYQQQPITF
jgi:hypothetical protein